MRQAEKLSPEQIRVFLEASEEVEFEAAKREEVYIWVSRTLRAKSYGRQQRGLWRRYIEKLTGLSRAQVTRLRPGGRTGAMGHQRARLAGGTGTEASI